MSLSKEVSRHHTAWVSFDGRPATPVRYATAEDELICFGDSRLRDLHPGMQPTISVHAIACGPPLEIFEASVRVIEASELSLQTVAEVHGNAPDKTPWPNSYDWLRHNRKFLGLRPVDQVDQVDQTDR